MVPFFSRIGLIYAVCISNQVLKFLSGQKIKLSISLHFLVKKMRIDERISNLVSKFKSDKI